MPTWFWIGKIVLLVLAIPVGAWLGARSAIRERERGPRA